ncbi:unnamed protein product [Cyprideis torosa]|uniref:Uncharacterized protein n=1 Tax=Cyprideis torosa TaxID=163714 RepID=A0A7R8W9X7_9CRUS|nr:unnamed protein product [Cyprideis torosa]CAG0885324.1 unnamed protein product [Cyprideis torosa]
MQHLQRPLAKLRTAPADLSRSIPTPDTRNAVDELADLQELQDFTDEEGSKSDLQDPLDVQSEPKSEPENEPEPEPQNEPEPEPQNEPEPEPQNEPEPEPQNEPKPEPQNEPESEEIENDTEPESDSELLADSKIEPDSKNEQEQEPQNEPEPENEPQNEPEPKSDDQQDSEFSNEPEPDGEGESEPEPYAEVDSEEAKTKMDETGGNEKGENVKESAWTQDSDNGIESQPSEWSDSDRDPRRLPFVIEAMGIEQSQACITSGGYCALKQDCQNGVHKPYDNLCSAQAGDGVACCNPDGWNEEIDIHVYRRNNKTGCQGNLRIQKSPGATKRRRLAQSRYVIKTSKFVSREQTDKWIFLVLANPDKALQAFSLREYRQLKDSYLNTANVLFTRRQAS